MLAFAVHLAAAAPLPPALPPEEERLELESLRQLQLSSAEPLVPAWPDMRPFRRNARNARDGALVGIAIGAVSGILLASALPDRDLVWEPRSSCERRQVLLACL